MNELYPASAASGTDFPSMTLKSQQVSDCRQAGVTAVGDGLRALSAAELEQHIAECGWHMEVAYARFQAHGDPADRKSAKHWLQLQTEAIAARTQAQRDLMEQVLDEGLDYFAAEGSHIRRMNIARGLA